MQPSPIEVTAAVIRQDDKIFAARRAAGKHLAGYWEFPGGKLEPGESAEDCLERELREELAIEVKVGNFLGANFHDYGSKQVRLLAYDVLWLSGEFELHDHDDCGWFTLEELRDLDLAPADIPLLSYLSSPQSGQP